MPRDIDLTGRILLTLALVLAIDLLFVGVLAALLEPWLSALRAALAAALGRPVPAVLWWAAVVGVALLAFLSVQLSYTRGRLLADADARVVDAEAYPQLHERLTRLASLADVGVPAVAVADSRVPNSFAVGGLRGSTIVVSEGLLATLGDDQLEAVLAHELAHVANRDALVMTLARFLPALAADDDIRSRPTVESRTASLARWAIGALVAVALAVAFVRDPVRTLVVVGFTVVVAAVALGVLAAPVVALSRRLSRDREFVADREGAALTGDPAALATALERLDGAVATPPARDGRLAGGVRALCLLPYGFRGEPIADREASGETTKATTTHPPTVRRIERLQELAAEL